MNCTLFAIAAHELDASLESSLPGYDDASASRTGARYESSAPLALGTAWPALHVALGDRGADHPLGFLEAGGEERAEFAGPQSRGRYFTPAATVKILAALARLTRPSPDVERLRVFVAETVASERGLVVHQFT